MLYCKPSPKSTILIEQTVPPSQTFYFRSLLLKKDIPILHRWVNEAYAKPFWQLDGSIEQLLSTYKAILKNPDGHSFIGLLDEQLICQVDLYRVQAGDLGKYIRCHEDDCGMHLLMAPAAQPIPGLSKMVMEVFMRWYFSFPQSQALYAEPDIYNHKATRLLQKAKFGFVQNVMLTDKAASIYLITRKQFYATYH